MSTPRLSLVLPFVALALVFATSAAAGVADRGPAGSGATLSLVNGKGFAAITSNDGSVFGEMAQGKITLVDYARGTPTTFDARDWGCEKKRRPNRKTVICSGTELTFRVVGGAWFLSLNGRRIYASAVVTGKVLLRGTRGTFSINYRPSRPWPEIAHTYKLGG
jgi:hypothetical protein